MVTTTVITPQTLELAEQLGQCLLEKEQTIATAESCTGGGIGYAITEVAGSSAWFNGGLITYTNDLKRQLLNVSQKTLEQDGAVSAECVKQMALGAQAQCNTSWAIAVSGVAGPGGGTAEKPVGLVWMALVGPDCEEVWSQTFTGNRQKVRSQTIDEVLGKAINQFLLQ
ncbi:CinA family protein [Idiomarina sp. UBA4520]|uniref:CinA family protein n=1 Tax=Idiomarina sp. UBA4520 TaxID=1946647 RepID=UPI000AB18225|nr:MULTISPECIES: CinA family protein [unclassified Idiomarina]|tara:strand:+ start:46070 stop:46576 length:507 start_codon:yes stop_codon:yes gene_type:complete